jgi:signal peptidase I
MFNEDELLLKSIIIVAILAILVVSVGYLFFKIPGEHFSELFFSDA